MANVRVRFAPSPTGYLHVGGARTALYNWLFARHHGGVFILRIEDTDADRSKPELVTAILDSLEWLGLNWDEGPFRQSERVARYREVAAELERLGHAYPCFCTAQELQAKRARAEQERRPGKYDGTCRNLARGEQERRRAEGRAAALRFRVPDSGETSFDDLVFGRVAVENREIEDFVLFRSDGNPTYHLGVVVDDLDMKITHVVRGADHLSNTPKQVLAYSSLGAPLPVFAHLPLILIISLDEMVREFTLEAVSKSNAVFDPEKLAWMNSEILRRLPEERLLSLAQGELESAGLWRPASAPEERERFRRAVPLLQTRARTLKDFSASGRAFFADEFDYEREAVGKFWKDPRLAGYLGELAERLSRLDPFDAGQAENCLRGLAEEKGVKAGLLINAARVALTGQAVAPGLFDVMITLGRERVVARLRRAAQVLREGAGADVGGAG